jgi:serine/threonine protein phosphatase 1
LLFDVVEFQPTDTLFLLGDYINKGPDSRAVLNQIIQLMAEGFNVHCLRGNHEQYLLDCLADPYNESQFLSKGGIETLESFGVDAAKEIPAEYLEFISKLDYYIELPDFLLVHAGFNFEQENIFESKHDMLTIRKMTVDPARIKGRNIIHGHVPTPIVDIAKSLEFPDNHISIDGGCVYHHIHALSHLVALDIQERKLYIQRNID